MTPLFHLPETPDLVVASDVHIRTRDDERSVMLQQLIDEAKRVRAKVFVLNGDIFDFFFGWGPHFRTKHTAIFSRLESLAAEGCKIYFIEGNHEFGMDHMPTVGVTFMDGFGDVLEAGDGSKILVVHGDLMKHDWKYLLFRALVRSRFVSFVASSIPQTWLDGFTLWLASTSRKKDRYRTLNHEAILACARNVLANEDAEHMIFGHFHHPYDADDGNGRRILSVDSWDVPSCLVLKDRKFQRIVAK